MTPVSVKGKSWGEIVGEGRGSETGLSRGGTREAGDREKEGRACVRGRGRGKGEGKREG